MEGRFADRHDRCEPVSTLRQTAKHNYCRIPGSLPSSLMGEEAMIRIPDYWYVRYYRCLD